ncbi:MAG: serine hydrolase [Nannocystaceae bacterium]
MEWSRRLAWLVGVVAAAGLLACGDPYVTNVGEDVLDSPTGDQLRWLLEVINERKDAPSTAEIEAHFTARLLKSFSAERMSTALDRWGYSHRTLTIEGIQPRRGAQSVFPGDARLGPVRVSLDIDPESGLIDHLFIKPYANRSLPEIFRAMEAMAPRVHLVLAELDDGLCLPLASFHGDERLSIASTSKLYLLLALVDAILEGELSWDTPLAIREEWKSGPATRFSEATSGTGFAVKELAEALIRNSDNTVNDHLVRVLGRRRIEEAVRASGHREPELNVPYMTSQEFFALRRLDSAGVDRYLALDASEREAYLDRVRDGVEGPSGGSPLVVGLEQLRGRIGIFASAHDLCALYATILQRADEDREAAQVLDVLSSPRRASESRFTRRPVWEYIGGKGGSTYGVHSNTWLLRRSDDRWFLVVVGYNGHNFDRIHVQHMFPAIEMRLIDLLDNVE